MSKYIAIGLIFLLCLSSVQSVLTAKTTAYPAAQCAGGTHTPSTSRFTSAAPITTTPPQIDGVSYKRSGYTDADNEAIEIRYAVTGASNAWVIIFTFAKSTGVSFTRTVPVLAVSDAPVLLSAQKNIFVFLVGSGASAIRKAYRINTSAVSNIVDTFTSDIYNLGTPTAVYSTATSITNFKVVSIRDIDIAGTITCYVEGDLSGGGTYADFINYDMAYGGTIPTVSLKNNVYGTSALKLTPPVANLPSFGFLPELFFDRTETTESGIVSFVGTYSKVPATVVDVGNKGTVQVRSFKLSMIGTPNQVCALTFVDGLNLDIVYGPYPTSVSFVTVGNTKSHTAPTAKPWKIYSDNLQHLLAVTSDKIFWIYSGKQTGGPFVADPTQTGDYSGNDLNIYASNSVTFSGELAFALTTGQITVYQVVSATVVNLYASITLANDILTQIVPANQLATIACQCSTIAVKRFTCFSSTLACTTTVNVAWAACA